MQKKDDLKKNHSCFSKNLYRKYMSGVYLLKCTHIQLTLFWYFHFSFITNSTYKLRTTLQYICFHMYNKKKTTMTLMRTTIRQQQQQQQQ